uniref:zinc finger E-box-binding homeobox 2-like isoform X1 n=1 Tax=Myxine glutinosa TaxID=7769 RepID=UPI00358EFC76
MKPEPTVADGPRCKRRKQANPRRKHVLQSYENVIEGGSDTEDEDCLQIAEEASDDSLRAVGPLSRAGPDELPSLAVAMESPITIATHAITMGGDVALPNRGDASFPGANAVMAGRSERGYQEKDGRENKRDQTWKSHASPLYNGVKDEICSIESEARIHVHQRFGLEIRNEPQVDYDDCFGRRKAAEADHKLFGNIAEFLQRSDTAVIYPEAPDDPNQQQGTPEREEPNENGRILSTPDAFSQLLACPYCDRGYKRLTSLKEHIRYRHERGESDGPLICPLCPGSAFTTRAQLDRHAGSHARQQEVGTQAEMNRKFKCSECGKAFKYKHHLKEHLRIHSGEKPYECPNCKKRFSHSGSYSSHISSKKCIGQASPGAAMTNGGRLKMGIRGMGSPPSHSPTSPDSQALSQLRQKLQGASRLSPEHLHLSLPDSLRIKAEPQLPSDYFQDFRTSASGFTYSNGGSNIINSSTNLPMNFSAAMFGSMQPSLISQLNPDLLASTEPAVQNLLQSLTGGEDLRARFKDGELPVGLNEVHKVLRIVDNTVSRLKACTPLRDDGAQILERSVKIDPEAEELTAAATVQGVATVPKSHALSRLSPFLAQNGMAKSIIDYTLEKVNEAKVCLQGFDQGSLIENGQELEREAWQFGRNIEEGSIPPFNGQNVTHKQDLDGSASGSCMHRCQFCGQAFAGPIPLHQHERYLCKMNEEIKAVLIRPSPERKTLKLKSISTEGSISPETHRERSSPNTPAPEMSRHALYGKHNAEDFIKAEMLAQFSRLVCARSFPNRCPNRDNLCSLQDSAHANVPGGTASNGEGSSESSPLTSFCLPQMNVGVLHHRSPLRRTNKFSPSRLLTASNYSHISRSNTPSSPLNLSVSGHQIDQTQNGCSHSPNGVPRSTSNGSLSSDDILISSQAEPLDLSLPKASNHIKITKRFKMSDQDSLGMVESGSDTSSPTSQQDEPLNLTFFKKEPCGHGDDEITGNITSITGVRKPAFDLSLSYGTKPQPPPLYSAFPPLSTFPHPGNLIPSLHAGRMPELGPYAGLDQLPFFPHLAYHTSFHPIAATGDFNLNRKFLHRGSAQAEDGDHGSDSDSGLPHKKLRKGETGCFSCDLCDKTFQKSSSLLRHKYEHTGKRPHQCEVCNKAFKHKHHLIEHSRLHSGEKPYQCDRCGKRFSHSGSYSQHMNHRYSYCRRGEADTPEGNSQRVAMQEGGGVADELTEEMGSAERGRTRTEDEERSIMEAMAHRDESRGDMRVYQGVPMSAGPFGMGLVTHALRKMETFVSENREKEVTKDVGWKLMVGKKAEDPNAGDYPGVFEVDRIREQWHGSLKGKSDEEESRSPQVERVAEERQFLEKEVKWEKRENEESGEKDNGKKDEGHECEMEEASCEDDEDLTFNSERQIKVDNGSEATIDASLDMQAAVLVDGS